MIVPDWPTNVAYFSTTPDEETSFYNFYYGPNGKFPYWPTNLTYAQAISADTDIALGHLTSGSIYTHTFHIANLRDYGGGKTLLTDWVSSLLGKYSSYYKVPVLNPGWPALAQYAAGRNSHFAELIGGRGRGLRPDREHGHGHLAGRRNGHRQRRTHQRTSRTYGTDVSASLTLTAGGSVVFTPSLRP